MKITNTEIFLLENINNEKLKAYATITIDDCLVIHDLRIIEGDQRLFVAMPSRRKNDNTFEDIVHPINRETRTILETLVLDVYQKEKSKVEI